MRSKDLILLGAGYVAGRYLKGGSKTLMGKVYKPEPEVVVIGSTAIGATRKRLPQVRVTVSRGKSYETAAKMETQTDVIKAMRQAIGRNTMETREAFIWLYLSNNNKVIGYSKQTLGGATSTVVDIPTGIKGALDVNATAVIVAHNHPSGNLTPSQADKQMTSRIKNALSNFGINLLDSLVITKTGHRSVY